MFKMAKKGKLFENLGKNMKRAKKGAGACV